MRRRLIRSQVRQPGCLSRRRLRVAGLVGWLAMRVHPTAGAHPRHRQPGTGDRGWAASRPAARWDGPPSGLRWRPTGAWDPGNCCPGLTQVSVL